MRGHIVDAFDAVVTDDSFALAMVDKTSGSELWRTSPEFDSAVGKGGAMRAGPPIVTMQHAIAVEKDRNRWGVVVRNLRTGLISWRRDGENVAVGVRVAFVFQKADLSAIEIDGGIERWRKDLPLEEVIAPRADGDLLLVGAEHQILAVDTHKGHTRWVVESPRAIVRPVAFYRDVVYALFEDISSDTPTRSIRALRRRDGRELWRLEINVAHQFVASALQKGVILINDPATEALAFDARTGRRLWKTTTSTDTFTEGSLTHFTGVVHGKQILSVRDYGTQLVEYDLETGHSGRLIFDVRAMR